MIGERRQRGEVWRQSRCRFLVVSLFVGLLLLFSLERHLPPLRFPTTGIILWGKLAADLALTQLSPAQSASGVV